MTLPDFLGVRGDMRFCHGFCQSCRAAPITIWGVCLTRSDPKRSSRQMDFPSFAQIVTTVGIPGALTIFFVWQGNVREARMAARIDSLEDYIRTEQAEQLDVVAEALRKNSEVLTVANQTMQQLSARLN